MSLTEREKFIHHFITLTTLRAFARGMTNEGEITQEEKNDVAVILKTRCRKLSPEDVAEIMEDLAEEALLGGSVINEQILD